MAVEVKSTRRGASRWRPGARLDRRGVERLRRAARHAGRHLGVSRWRVDLIEVHAPEPGRRLRMVHHQDLKGPVTADDDL